MERIDKKKAAQFVKGLKDSGKGSEETFNKIKSALGMQVKPQREEEYNEQTDQLEEVRDNFSPSSFTTTTDTQAEHKKAMEVLRKLRGEQYQSPTPPPAIPGDQKALMDQADYLQQLQDFEQATPDDMQKLQRIKDLMMRQK